MYKHLQTNVLLVRFQYVRLRGINISLVLSGGAAIPSGCGRIHKALQLFQGARLALSKASAADLPGGYGSSWSVASTRSL